MAEKLPTHSLLASRGASFGTDGAWELPLAISEPGHEYRAAREGTGILDLSFRAFVEVSGADAARFLNGMLTNDLASLPPGRFMYATTLNPRGKMMTDMTVYALEERFLLELEPARWTPLLEHLEHYIIADDVTLTDLRTRSGLLAIEGPQAADLIGRLTPDLLPEPGHHAEVMIAGTACRLAHDSVTSGPGFKVLCPRDRTAFLWEAAVEAGALPVGMQALETLRIEAGIPRFGVDMTEEHFPQEVAIEDRGVSFNKGCYVGQEFVIRIHHRGHVNRRLAGIACSGETVPLPGDPVYREEKEVGRVSSATISPALAQPIALAILRRECLEPGTAVEIDRDGTRLKAEVVTLPFYPRR
ncbi:MAG: aminomethyltransferase family protein [Candidatus Methylomirabilales bacterium]